MSLGTLRAMARGGIYDQVGGGFSRYSVDATWTVPHFEKMLYDNALLARAYLHGWQVSGRAGPAARVRGDARLGAARDARARRRLLRRARRRLRGRGGQVLRVDARASCAPRSASSPSRRWPTSEPPRRELRARATCSRPAAPSPRSARRSARRLYAARAQRVRPGLDDKRLCSWNALMISALAEAGAALTAPGLRGRGVGRRGVPARLELRDAEGQLLRTWKDGRGQIDGYLEDHAFTVQALTALYEATFDPRWYREAVALADAMIERFADPERGGFFTTAADRPLSFARRKDLEDSPIPSGNSAAAFGLLRLARLSGSAEYERHALGGCWRCWPRSPAAIRWPSATRCRPSTSHLARVREVAIAGSGPEARRAGRASSARAIAPMWCWPAGPRSEVPLLAGPRAASTAGRPPTCASTSPARRRSAIPTAARRGALEHRQVALQLPGRDLDAVVVPLLALDLDVAVEHVLAERAQHEL